MQIHAELVVFGLVFLLGSSYSFPDYEADTPPPQQLTADILQNICEEYPDLTPCHYINSLAELQPDQDDGHDREKRSTQPVNESAATNESTALEKRDTSKEEEPPWFVDNEMDPPLEKRFADFRGQLSQGEGYKRGPGFRSWGGKRGGNKFSNWGGKRNEVDDIEKRKFNSWGGKRDSYLVLPEEEKRKFNSWGGKRDSWDEDEELDVPGKRTFPYSLEGRAQYFLRRSDLNKFLNWGGKRKFSSWGGKRADEDLWKRYFQPWGGKRDNGQGFRSWGGKRGNGQGFRSWGGKRSEETTTTEGAVRAKRGSSQFYPWAGR